jgi:uncharacterized protein YukE
VGNSFDIDTTGAANAANQLITEYEGLVQLLNGIDEERQQLSASFIGLTSNAYNVANMQWQEGQRTMNASLQELADLLDRTRKHYIASDEQGAQIMGAGGR